MQNPSLKKTLFKHSNLASPLQLQKKKKKENVAAKAITNYLVINFGRCCSKYYVLSFLFLFNDFRLPETQLQLHKILQVFFFLLCCSQSALPALFSPFTTHMVMFLVVLCLTTFSSQSLYFP